ncbi:MAG: hypothetical protein RQ760_00380 [Sedimentisphaerales bacterium]|nr:hypothetical protein [Sedimentisphaerales bacterium]
MEKIPAMLILLFFLAIIPAASGFGAETPHENLLWDGFVLMGVNGKITPTGLPGKSEHVSDSNTPFGHNLNLNSGDNGWFYEFTDDVNDLRAKAPAGTTLELLPSATLEKLIADVNERSANTYRLSGWITKYKGRNFIFPNHFLPVSTIIKQQPQTDQKPEEGIQSTPEKESDQPDVSEPNDLLAMPKEIMERLKTGRVVRPPAPRRTPKTKKIVLEPDSILADRSAFLVKEKDGRLVFVLDALGRNDQPVSLRLLPCEALEMTELTQAAIPIPVRFKIAGLVTKYKGEKYLLLHRANRIYSHGNFAR